MSKVYLQLMLKKECRELTAISTHKRVYVHNKVPFGINAFVGIFLNRFAEKIKHLENMRVCFDEIFIFGNSEEEHFKTMFEILNIIKA